MGIKNLLGLIKSKASSSISSLTPTSLQDKTIAIDCSILFYASSIATNFSSKSKILQDSNGNPTAHLIQILNHSVQYKKSNTSPIWVFEGEPPKLKQPELQRRKLIKQESLTKLSVASDLSEQQKYLARSFRLSDQMIEDSKSLINFLGHAHCISPNEAEAQCAILGKSSQCDLVLSQDSDSLVFGAPAVIMGKEPQIIELSKILTELNLTFPQFVDLAILMGSDYAAGIKGLGQVKALQMMQNFGNIEKIVLELKNNEKFQINENFLNNFEEIRNFFLQPFETQGEVIKSDPDPSKLQEFLISKAFSEKNVDRYMKKLGF